MTGKEDWEKKYREEIEEVNLRADMLCAWNDELENKLSKCERAFEILKDSEIIKIGNNPFNNTYYLQRNDTNGNIVVIKLTKEEYELLEELMNCGTKDN